MSKARVTAAAAAIGVEVESGRGPGGFFEVTLDAPEGYVMVASGTYSAVSSGMDAAEAWRAAAADVAAGIAPDPEG